MVVQHNLTAMNSNRMLGVTTKQQAKTTEKLSSGYKINRAADDAAGLAISEKMRKQIRGLTQASANAQDGISAVQTAEGALTEVHDMLQRINELAVKAANGTQSESDRQAIQSEVDQLVTEIDRVSETTKFNETYLLKGDKSVEKGYSYSYGAVKKDVAATAKMDTDSATGLTAAVEFETGAAAADQNALAKALRDQGMSVSVQDGKYEVTLNGKAATNYKVNKESDSKFEITDLRGNKIATITASGGGTTKAPGTATILNGTTAANLKDKNNVALDAKRLAQVLDEGGKVYYTAADVSTITNRVEVSSMNAGGVTTVTNNIFLGTDAVAGEYQYYAKDATILNGDTAAAAGWYNNKTGAAITADIKDGASAVTTGSMFTVKSATAVQAGDKVVIADKNLATAGTDYTYTPGTSTDEKRSAVITANTITAAENEGDVARFYDRDGNAISNNALGNYFSVLSAGSGGGTAEIKDSDKVLNEEGNKFSSNPELAAYLGTGKKVYSTPPGLELTKSNSATAVKSGTALKTALGTNLTDGTFKVGDVFVFNKAAGGWLKEGGDPTKIYANAAIGIDTTAHADNTKFVDGEKLTIGLVANTGTESRPGMDYTYTPGEKVAARAGAQLYDAVGNTLTMTDAAENVASNKNLMGVLNLGLHVGADSTSDNQIELNVEAMSAKGLGLNGLKVGGTNATNALDAIETVKEAISKVSAQRSTLGAVQNRLEHTINNLDNVVENTTSAESAIRDTDMATTMVQYSKNNILAQAGTSMLAQANQSNQSVLSLLQ